VYLDVAQASETLAALRKAQARYERPAELGELEITVTPPPGAVDLDTAHRYADLGVDRLAIQPSAMDSSDVEALIETVGETIIGQV
jgi:hypothetical protein